MSITDRDMLIQLAVNDIHLMLTKLGCNTGICSPSLISLKGEGEQRSSKGLV